MNESILESGFCPICESKMYGNKRKLVCFNGCYIFKKTYDGVVYQVFNDLFYYYFLDSLDIIESIEKEAILLIKKWKENEKYLIKILENV